MWCLHSTLITATVYLASFYLGTGERGAYANAVLALAIVAGFSVSRNQKISDTWAIVCLTTVFSISAAATSLTLLGILSLPAGSTSPEWWLSSVVVSAIGTLVALACTAYFSFDIAKKLNLSRTLVLSVFGAQGVVLYFVFRYGPLLVQEYFGS